MDSFRYCITPVLSNSDFTIYILLTYQSTPPVLTGFICHCSCNPSFSSFDYSSLLYTLEVTSFSQYSLRLYSYYPAYPYMCTGYINLQRSFIHLTLSTIFVIISYNLITHRSQYNYKSFLTYLVLSASFSAFNHKFFHYNYICIFFPSIFSLSRFI